MPFNLQYANQQWKAEYPYFRLSLNPSIGKFKIWVGHFGLNFSSYALSNRLMFGEAVEYKISESWSITGYYARLQKALVQNDSATGALQQLLRRSAGLKLENKTSSHNSKIYLFSAWDIANDSIPVLPTSNVIAGILDERQIIDRLTLRIETGFSFKNTILPDKPNSLFSRFFPNQEKPEVAGRLEAYYQARQSSVGIGLEQIPLNYQNYGSYFQQTDLRNFTLNLKKSVAERNLQFTAKTGMQQSNISKNQVATAHRFILAVNSSCNIASKLNLQGSFSNFQTTTSYDPERINSINSGELPYLADTTSRILVNRQMSLNLNRRTQNQEALGVQLHHQVSTSLTEKTSSSWNVRLVREIKAGENLQLSFNAFYFIQNQKETFYANYGPGITVLRHLFKKTGRLQWCSKYNYRQHGSAASGNDLLNQLTCSWQPPKAGRFSINLTNIIRGDNSQYIFQMNYAYAI